MTGTQLRTVISFLCPLSRKQAGCKVEVVEGGFRCREGAGNNGGTLSFRRVLAHVRHPKNVYLGYSFTVKTMVKSDLGYLFTQRLKN